MCGILGFVDKRNTLSPAARDALWRTMVAAIAHRGGEGEGVHQSGNVTLAHTRLRILDLHPRSDQPFAAAQCRAVLIFNGQIYNHRALRTELAPHFEYRTESDTETLLYAYARWKRGLVERLRGMYAFGIWDEDSREVTLGVDPLGIKPLYYLNTDTWFAWSSEVKPLLMLPGVRPQLDESALHEFLGYRGVSGARTLFAGIQRLQPAQMAVYDTKADTLRVDTYWRPERVEPANGTASVDDVRDALHASVVEHAPADVPVGVQLSGGLDSSLIAGLLREVLPQSYELHSYCIGSDEVPWSEFGYARQAARSARTIHHEIPFDGQIFASSLHRATYHLDEPINHPNTVPLMHLAAEARKQVKVLFSGEGADELFCGYKRHVRFLREPPSASRLARSNQVNGDEIAGSVLRGAAKTLGQERLALAEAVSRATPARQLTIYDLHHHLPGHLLRQDKMGMSANLETRVPFLDRRLVEIALALPDAQKIILNNRAGGDRKRVLKAVADKYLPSSILKRQKRGFGLPVARWLRSADGLGGTFKQLLVDDQRRSFLNYPAIQQLFAQHQKGTQDTSDILWPLLALEVWCRCFLDGEAAPQPKRTPARVLEPA